jgi:hypothetical protein
MQDGPYTKHRLIQLKGAAFARPSLGGIAFHATRRL